ncbi:DNA recombination protein RmuC, partial [Salmonella enterica]|uniref:DNA recombination protein RmuC n=1 Tax=Salmonella enterica TaxID=28901 RepID=UPI00398C37CB
MDCNVWSQASQSRSVRHVAGRGGKPYGKLGLLVDDMSADGQGLDKAQDSYRQAMKKLASGRGNVLAQAEAFRGLG